MLCWISLDDSDDTVVRLFRQSLQKNQILSICRVRLPLELLIDVFIQAFYERTVMDGITGLFMQKDALTVITL